MNFAKVNEVASAPQYLPTKKLTELETNKIYKVSGVRQVKTKFGLKTIVDIENTFTVFLPGRVSKLFEEDQQSFKGFCDSCTKNTLGMQYFGGKYNQIAFNES